jgi:hypothetical protein
MPETLVVYDNVEVLEHDGLGFTCRIGDARVFVGKYVPMNGTDIGRKGDRGRLTLPRWFVEQQGLPLDQHLTDAEVDAWYAHASFQAQAAREYAAAHPDGAEAQARLHRAEEELEAAMIVRAQRRDGRR